MLAAARSLLLLSVIVASTSAFAERYEDNDRVSTMKGHLVEVGDRNKFHYDFPRLNLAVNPFGLMYGHYGFSGSYAVTSNIAVRGDVNYTEEIEDQDGGYELGLSTQVFFRKMYNGIFLEPGIVRIHRDRRHNEDYDVFGPQIMLGYSWFWDSGFNVAIAMGGGRSWMKPSEEDADRDEVEERAAAVDADDDREPTRFFGNAYLRVGYAF